MSSIAVEQHKLNTVFAKADIDARIEKMGKEISALYNNEPLVAVCVLKGAFIFFSDLVRSINLPKLELDFVRLASYGSDTCSSGHVIFNKDVELNIFGKHVLIVEDIVDTGHTMKFLLSQFAARKPLSLRIAALIDKSERRKTEVAVDFAGFKISKGFLVGYGLDYDEHYRSLSNISEIEFAQQ